ncbi:GTPase [Alicyclobacillus tengchongensis]|nr:GTPase [Alicyclobacillus tengchongensis]
MPVQWYPGHMAKARRIMEDRVRQVDVVIELVDARLPLSSRNPVLQDLSAKKPRLVVMTREDLADPRATHAWLAAFASDDILAVSVNTTNGNGFSQVRDGLRKLAAAKIQRAMEKGLQRAVVRAMVVGIPNVGKSSFINQFAKRSVAKTGNKPGVTRTEQWVRMGDIELLDTPGVLWPKIETPEQGLRLAISGAVKDQIYDMEEGLAFFLCFASRHYPDLLIQRYGLSHIPVVEWTDLPTVWPQIADVVEEIGRKRGMLGRGGVVDEERVAKMVIKEVQDGVLGHMTFEWPQSIEDDRTTLR